MNSSVNIDFEVMRYAVKKHAREKAIKFGSTLIYVENGRLIEEDPSSSKKIVLKTYHPSR